MDRDPVHLQAFGNHPYVRLPYVKTGLERGGDLPKVIQQVNKELGLEPGSLACQPYILAPGLLLTGPPVLS